MFTNGWRSQTWNSLQQDWDMIIIGGGITGAGVFRRAVSAGLKVLLVEANDFASGTSSRSSKLVHGGFRYLRNRQYDVTRESVREREKILQEASQMVTPLGFILPYSGKRGMQAQFKLGVMIYDLMAPKWKHSHLTREEILDLVPQMNAPWILGAFLYYDAMMDDARMVQRLISETIVDGGTALNYTKAARLLRQQDGTVCGTLLHDQSPANLGGQEVTAKVVVNATGPWSDSLRAQLGQPARLRPQRGSHLIFPEALLPLPDAVTIMHPRDNRAMFAIPWEGTTMIGTTDLDHPYSMDKGEPYCTQQEIDYILEATQAFFPSAGLTQSDMISSFAGLRPIVSSGAANPSAESRHHVVWEEEGLITITGGKLSIFRLMAEDTLQKAAPHIGRDLKPIETYYKPLPNLSPYLSSGLGQEQLLYLAGRYGNQLKDLLNLAQSDELSRIESLSNLWVELRFAAHEGAVEHLDDLLLRRVRLGMLLPEGAIPHMAHIRSITQEELGWDDARWEKEEQRYGQIYQKYYSKAPTGF